MHFAIKQSIFTVISFALMSVGVVLGIYWKDIIHSLLVKNVELTSEWENFRVWQNPQFDIMFDIYLFNWTNPSDLNGKKDYQKPILEQLGPYRFREKHMKTRMEWHPHNYTVSYKRKGTYFFDEKGSKGRLNDKIVSINTFAATIAQTGKDLNWAMKKLVSKVLSSHDQKAYIIKEAHELLFDGYQDKLIDRVRTVQGLLPLPVKMPYDRFGYMYGRNESEDYLGHFNVNTGKDDITKLGLTRTWNYETASPLFKNPCNNIRGSSGELFPPDQSKDRSIAMFNGDLCRHIDLYFDKETKINGINAYKYVSTERSLDNGTKYSENECFNVKSFPSGVSDISGCRFGAPLVASLPHFYAADPYFLEQVDGLSPNKEDHEIFIAIDPVSGSPLNLIGRLQISTVVRPTPSISLFENTPEMFFPVLWIQQNLYVPDDITSKLLILAWLPIIGYTFIGFLILIGISILMCTFLCKCCKRTRNREHVIKGKYGKREPKPANNIQTNNAEAETSTNERY